MGKYWSHWSQWELLRKHCYMSRAQMQHHTWFHWKCKLKSHLLRVSSHISSYFIIQSWKILPNTIYYLQSHQILLIWHKGKDQDLAPHLPSRQRAAFRVHFHYNPFRNVTSATLPSSFGTTCEAATVLCKSWLLIHIILKNLEVTTARFWDFLKYG